MGHALLVGECACGGVIYRGTPVSEEGRVVLDRSSHYEWTAVRQNDHSVAKHIPTDRLNINVAGLGIPKRGLQIGICIEVS